MSISESIADLGKAGQGAEVSTRSKEDAEELAKLDQLVERMRKVIPQEPYILSTPTDHPYHRADDQERRSWIIGDLFEPREEYLQYGTWQYRDRNDTVFHLRSRVDERMQKEAALARSRDLLKARLPATPVQGATKKISYSDYKAKQNGTLGTPLSKKTSPELGPVQPPQRFKLGANGIKPIVNGSAAPVQVPAQQGEKRPFEDSQDSTQPSKTATEDGPPPAKKAKPSSPRPTQHSKSSSNASNQSNSTPHGLPPLLSPTSLPNPYGLPPILSPTLPPNIQAELNRIEARQRTDSNASSSSDVRSQHLAIPDLKNQRSDESLKGVARKVHRNGEVKSQGERFDSKAATSTPVRSHVRDEPLKESPIKAKKTLIVKLKIPKKHRNQISRILRLPPANKTAADKKERQEILKERVAKAKHQQEQEAKAEARSKEEPREKAIKQAPTSAKTAVSATTSDTTTAPKSAKRPRPADDSTPLAATKRVKAPAALDVDKRPSTPSDQAIPSPALTNVSSAQKSQSQLITPRKDLRALNMVRSASSPGNDVTPGRGSTPTIVQKPTEGRTSGSNLLPISDKVRRGANEWNECKQRATTLGRTLKHEADRFEEKSKDLTGAEKHAKDMRLAVMSIECILAFMVGFHASDASYAVQSKPQNIEATWRTLLPLAFTFRARTSPFPHLDGLRHHLTAIIAGRILRGPWDRADRLEMPQEGAAPTEAATKQHRRFAKDVALLFQASAEAAHALSLEHVIDSYPRTWERRDRGPMPTAGMKQEYGLPSKGDLDGPFWLPVTTSTTPIHGVRMGVRLLEEFLASKADGQEIGDEYVERVLAMVEGKES